MALPTSFYSETIADNTRKQNGSPETANWQVPVITTDAANFASVTALLVTLRAATQGLIIGVAQTQNFIASRVLLSTLAAASTAAQRENKFLARYHDSVTFKKFSVSIPTANLALLTANSEFVSLTAGAGLSFKSAFEAAAVSPDNDQNTVVLDSLQFVGRNS